MKRVRDSNDNVYLRVNQDQADVLRRFTEQENNAEEEGMMDDRNRGDAGDSWHGAMSLGFKHGSSHAEIRGIREMPMPREDGYRDNVFEQAEASDRPYGHAYFSDQLQRQRIMEDDDNYHWVEILSGLMNKSPIDLYQESDIDRLLMEREAERLRMQREISRTIVSDKEKKRERETLVQYKRDVQVDLATYSSATNYHRLVRLGQYLIDGSKVTGHRHSDRFGMVPLTLMAIDVASAMLADPPTDASVVAREQAVVEAHKGGGDKDVGELQPSQKQHYAFIQLTLFTYLFNLKEGPLGAFVLGANGKLARQCNALLPDLFERVRAGDETALKDLPGVDGDSVERLTAVDQDLAPANDIDWQSLMGTETVVLSRVASLYDQATLSKMVEYGLRNQYGSVALRRGGDLSYANLMWAFLNGEPGFAERLSEAGFNLRRDHPPALNALMDVAFGQDDDVALAVDYRSISRLIQSHCLWHYFNARSVRGLASDWFANAKSTDRTLLTRLSDAAADLTVDIKSALLGYFSIVIQLCNLRKVPVVLDSTAIYTSLRDQAIKPQSYLFQFPPNVASSQIVALVKKAGGDEEDDEEGLEQNAQAFDSLNRAFKGLDVATFIANVTFEQYYRTGRASFVQATTQGVNVGGRGPKLTDQSRSRAQNVGSGDNLVVLEEPLRYVQRQADTAVGQLYPVFALHYLFEVYDKFMGYYREFLAQRLDQLETGIQEVDEILLQIAREDLSRRNDRGARRPQGNPAYNQRLSFTGQPINNGIIRLKSTVTSFMEKAYDFVQDYCDELRGLPIEEYQTKAADACGLEVAFASFVAALIAENTIMHGSSYKSLSSQRNIMAHCGNELARLRKFGFRKTLNGSYEVFNLYGERRPGGQTVQQRQTIGRRVVRVLAS
jgi:hypothetical protein